MPTPLSPASAVAGVHAHSFVALPARQRTLAGTASCTGVGLHSGNPVTMTLHPAPIGHGIVFVRTDVEGPHNRVPARYDLITDTRLCSLLSNAQGVTVGTVEHIMAALAGASIDNAEIHLDGPEVPIMDGASALFSQMIEDAGTTETPVARRYIKVLAPLRVEAGDKWALLEPSDRPTFAFEIEFAAEAIGQQQADFTLMNGNFVEELAQARTFCLLSEVEAMRKAGLAKGGSLENAIVVDGANILNEEGLNSPDEFVRHKLLDAVGDLYLAGAPILGAYSSHKGGHALNNQLLRALFANPAAWTWAEVS